MMRWCLERAVFASGFDLTDAARRAGHEVTAWHDDWWDAATWPRFSGETVVFCGSLANADRVQRELPWRPGSFCDTAAFHGSAWYPRAARWLLNRDWTLTTAEQLVAAPPAGDRWFVRPDSPLKPFSGRVVTRDGLSLAALDHGFYYDDPALPVIVSPVREVDREWRLVVVEGRVVAGSGYEADSRRRAAPTPPEATARAFAGRVAAELEPPEAIYVLDVALADGVLHVVELNPFSGADLYACDPVAVVAAVAEALPDLA